MVVVNQFAEYSWRRKQNAVGMLAEWNRQTGDHRVGIDRFFPGLLDTAGPRSEVSLSEEEASDLYLSTYRGSPELFDTKRHIEEILNYCEFIAVSALNDVADLDILAGSFFATIHVWYHELEPYIRVAKYHQGYDPWTPLGVFIAQIPSHCPVCLGTYGRSGGAT
ncbi:MAG TPA: hypothetical protein VGS22_24680 [Thermoanaerobaculia bacterium]|nr:hypothetical protein [Thermoanaerobaculia bacterium]